MQWNHAVAKEEEEIELVVYVINVNLHVVE